MHKDNVDLICNIAELAGLFEKTSRLDDFLQTAVSIVAYHMKAAVCSVYLYDDEKQELVLTATQGLKREAIGIVRLGLGEGITGGINSHLAILARSLRVPMVIADERALLNLPGGTPMLMDAEQGCLHIRPAEEILEKYRQQEESTAEVSRTNEHISHLYVLHHPAVLRSINRIALAAEKFGKELSICGEMAAQKYMQPFLLGVGITRFSMEARKIPQTCENLKACRMDRAVELARTVLRMGRIDEIGRAMGAPSAE